MPNTEEILLKTLQLIILRTFLFRDSAGSQEYSGTLQRKHRLCTIGCFGLLNLILLHIVNIFDLFHSHTHLLARTLFRLYNIITQIALLVYLTFPFACHFPSSFTA